MRWILLLLMFTNTVFANVAVDKLNALLSKKESAERFKSALKATTPEIKNISENYYFVFIYKGSCPHCHNFAPVLKDFADSFHFLVTPYSLDNEPLPEFKGAPLTPALFQTFYVNGGYKPSVPALFLVNRHTLDAYAVLFGEAKDYELANRVSELMKHIEEKYHE